MTSRDADTATAEKTGAFLATTLLSAVLDTERSIAHLQATRPPNEGIVTESARRCSQRLAAVRDVAERLDRGSEKEAKAVLNTLLKRQARLIEAALDVVRHGCQSEPATPCSIPGCAVCKINGHPDLRSAAAR